MLNIHQTLYSFLFFCLRKTTRRFCFQFHTATKAFRGNFQGRRLRNTVSSISDGLIFRVLSPQQIRRQSKGAGLWGGEWHVERGGAGSREREGALKITTSTAVSSVFKQSVYRGGAIHRVFPLKSYRWRVLWILFFVSVYFSFRFF